MWCWKFCVLAQARNFRTVCQQASLLTLLLVAQQGKSKPVISKYDNECESCFNTVEEALCVTLGKRSEKVLLVFFGKGYRNVLFHFCKKERK